MALNIQRAGSAPVTPIKPAGGPAKSRWAGIKSHKPRDPLLTRGEYRVRFLGAEVTFNKKTGNETFQTTVEVVDTGDGSTVASGTVCKLLMIINGKSSDIGQGRVKAMHVAGAGYGSEDEYDAIDPDGSLIDATLNGAGLVGRLADVRVADVPGEGGRTFQEYEWFPFTEGQEQLVP